MMQSVLVAVQISAYFILLVLAGYALTRSRFHPVGVAIAGALVSFAAIQADQHLGAAFPGEGAWLGRILWAAYPLLVTFWVRVAILLKPGDNLQLERVWWTLVLPVAVLFILGGWVGHDLVDFSTREPGSLYWTFVVFNLLVGLGAAWLMHRNMLATSVRDRARRAFGWLRLASIGFAVSMAVLLAGWLPPAWVFALLAVDIVTLGVAGIAYDAIAEGQAIRRDLSVTFIKTVLAMAALVLPWIAGFVLSGLWSLALAGALYFSLGMVALGGTLLEEVEVLLDRLLFKSSAGEQQTREALRTLLRNTARRPAMAQPLMALDHDEFIRLTRRALSHMPNLPRLAASPLTNMQIVSQRVDAEANVLERARELRGILAECIDALRPQDRGDYGTTDEWRFFNALYYPYVVGISPYKRNLLMEELDPETSEVLRWFQVVVPQRTMYNWQNRGAEMIADILLEQERQLPP